MRTAKSAAEGRRLPRRHADKHSGSWRLGRDRTNAQACAASSSVLGSWLSHSSSFIPFTAQNNRRTVTATLLGNSLESEEKARGFEIIPLWEPASDHLWGHNRIQGSAVAGQSLALGLRTDYRENRPGFLAARLPGVCNPFREPFVANSVLVMRVRTRPSRASAQRAVSQAERPQVRTIVCSKGSTEP